MKPLLRLVAIRSVPVTSEAEARQRQVWERLFAQEGGYARTESAFEPKDTRNLEDDESGTVS